MNVATQSPVAAIDADRGLLDRTPFGQQLRRYVTIQRQRFGNRAVASVIRRLDHPGVLADYEANSPGR